MKFSSMCFFQRGKKGGKIKDASNPKTHCPLDSKLPYVPFAILLNIIFIYRGLFRFFYCIIWQFVNYLPLLFIKPSKNSVPWLSLPVINKITLIRIFTDWHFLIDHISLTRVKPHHRCKTLISALFAPSCLYNILCI